MTPTPLTVTVNDVTLTEAQVEAAAKTLAQLREARAEAERKAKRKLDRTLRVGSQYGGDYLNIPRVVFLEMVERFHKMEQPDYMVVEVDGTVGHNFASAQNAPRLRAFQKDVR